MLDGRIPNAVPDTARQPNLADLPITAQAGVGAYVGVPVELGDDDVYGTLCGSATPPHRT